MPRRQERLAFSLIEILVVMMILVALGAMLFPAISETFDKSQQAACSSNLRKIGGAFHQYVQDNGAFPAVYGGWYPLILPYLDIDTSKNISVTRPSVLKCPSNKKHQWNTQNLSYGYNTFLGNNYSTVTNIVSLRIGSFAYPSQVILCGDIDNRLSDRNATLNYNRSGSPPGITHGGGANLLYVDGHVEWKRPEEVTEMAGRYTAPMRRMWGMYGGYAD